MFTKRLRRRLRRRRALAVAADADRRHLRLGPGVDLRAQAAVLRRHAGASRPPVTDIEGARVLALLGDSVTTDHISPAGSIKPDSPAGRYLERARRRAQGLQLLRLAPRQPRGDDPRHVRQHPAAQPARSTAPRAASRATSSPDGEQTTIYDAAQAYAAAGVPLVVLAGKEYGSGSSPRLGRQGHRAARRPGRHRRELRADPPLQPGRHGRAAAAVPGGGVGGLAGADGDGDVRRSAASPGSTRAGRRAPSPSAP